MRPEPDDLRILKSRYRTLDIEELKSTIDNWEEKNNSSTRLKNLDMAKNELEIKCKERQEQIELLTKSLTSSSRIDRWISSVAAVIKQITKFNN